MKKKFIKITTFVLISSMFFLLKLPTYASDAAAFAPVFNSSYYAEANPDLKALFGTDETLLFHHFLNSGMKEGRQGNAEFNVHVYRENNPDLKTALGEDLTSYYVHYIHSGKAEGRVANNIPVTTSTPSTSSTPTAAPIEAMYNPANSLAASPLAPKAAESLASYGRYWNYIGSNGYPIKVKFDPYDLSMYSGSSSLSRWDRHNPANIIYDQPLSFRPESSNAFLWAYVDFVQGSTQGGTPAPEHFFISPSHIPLVEMPSTKLTSAVSTPSFEAFREAFRNAWGESLYNYEYKRYTYKTARRKGPDYKEPAELDRWLSLDLYPTSVCLSGTALYWAEDGSSIRFGLDYSNVHNSWYVTIKYGESNIPTELLWYGVRNLIRLVSPDAELIYPQIYEHFYGGNHVFPNYNTWVSVGNSQIMVFPPSPALYDTENDNDDSYQIVYFFK